MSRASTLSGFSTAIGQPTDLNVGVVTATRIDADNITASNTYEFNNLSITGIATFSDTVSIGSTLVGVTTISSSGIHSPLGVGTFLSVDTRTLLGNVSVAGTLTYEDVTNVDSLGIITTRGGIHVTGAGSSVGIGSTGPEVSLDVSQNTDAIGLPKGTTAQRPTGVEGFIRFNSTSKALEIYDGTNWVEIITDYFPSGSVILG
ncbi:hypothetical protein [Synechococcus phage S-B05]|nr:hypothetical protein [Synechococcus phage S-B05]